MSSIIDQIRAQEEHGENYFERYNRQCLIPNWDQDKLTNAKLAIVGGGWLGAYTALTATALGFGSITLIGNKKDALRRRVGATFMNAIFGEDSQTTKDIADTVAVINPHVKIKSLNTSLVNDASKYFLKNQDIIADLSNNPVSKAIVLEYCKQHRKKAISGSTTDGYGAVAAFNGTDETLDFFMPQFAGKKQYPLPSLPLSGIVVEEARKLAMGEEFMANPVYYNFFNDNRFTLLDKIKEMPLGYLKNRKKVLVVGAGALGNGIALALQHTNMLDVYVLDDDVVETTNLNRQILFYNSVGQKKTEALCKKLNAMGIKSTPIVGRFESAGKNIPEGIDMILGCVDNFETRLMISDYAYSKKIPVISGGTNYEAGQVAIYIPGKTPTIDDQLNLKESAKKAAEIASASCILSPNPSVITSNIIVSGLMGGELYANLYNNNVLHGILKYGNNFDNRLGYTPVNPVEKTPKKKTAPKKQEKHEKNTVSN